MSAAPEIEDVDDPQQLDQRISEMHRAIGVARRRQLLRLMPLRGRIAWCRHALRRVRAKLSQRPLPVAPDAAPPTVAGTERNDRAAELELGERRGQLVQLRTELDRAQQDLDVPYRAVVHHWLRRGRDQLLGRLRSVSAQRRAPARPRVSVLTTVYDTPPRLLREMLASVARQTFTDFEHILVDDCSPSPRLESLLARAARRDRRRVVRRRSVNGGIVAASSDALALARGELIALIDHDDLLEPSAIARMVAAFDTHPDAVMAYSDHDILTAGGRLTNPCYKPDFSPERLRCQNYITHFVVARREAVLATGGFREGFDGAQDHDLVLRLGEHGPVVHVPGVLYHWRQAPASVASDEGAKPYAFEAGRRAVEDHCLRSGIDAEVVPAPLLGCYEVRRRLHTTPLVSIVIPTRGSNATIWGERRDLVVSAVRSIEALSTYPNVEYVVVADAQTPTSVLDALRVSAPERLRIVPFDGPFNFSSKCNVGAAHSAGDVLLFLNDDTELVAPNSIEVMVGHLQCADVGIVGAKLRFSDGRLQHAGHVYPGGVDHALFGWPGSTVGPWRLAVVDRECSGVTAAAAAMRRAVFDEVDGFDAAFPVNFNDVDLSLRVRRRGYRVLWTPRAEWFHFESASRETGQTKGEIDMLLQRWRDEIARDPYFNEFLQPGRNDWLPRPLWSGVSPDVLGG